MTWSRVTARAHRAPANPIALGPQLLICRDMASLNPQSRLARAIGRWSGRGSRPWRGRDLDDHQACRPLRASAAIDPFGATTPSREAWIARSRRGNRVLAPRALGVGRALSGRRQRRRGRRHGARLCAADHDVNQLDSAFCSWAGIPAPRGRDGPRSCRPILARYGSDVMGCCETVTNDSHSRATARLGSQPAARMPRGGVERFSTAAEAICQFAPPQLSFVL